MKENFNILKLFFKRIQRSNTMSKFKIQNVWFIPDSDKHAYEWKRNVEKDNDIMVDDELVMESRDIVTQHWS